MAGHVNITEDKYIIKQLHLWDALQLCTDRSNERFYMFINHVYIIYMYICIHIHMYI